MAKAWLVDRWTKAATVCSDGRSYKVDPPPDQLSSKNLSKLEDRFKSARFGVGARWRVDWYEEDDDGQKRLRGKSFRLKKDAEDYQAKLEDDQRSGSYLDPTLAETGFGVAAEAWFKSKRKAGESTLLQYRGDLDRYVLPRWKQTKLKAINEEAINSWIEQLDSGTAPHDFKRGKPGPLSPTTLHRIVRIVFGGVLRFAVERRWIYSNPLARIELAAPETQKPEAWLTPVEVQALADAAAALGGPQQGTVIRTLAYCGLRINEAFALSVGDYDPDKLRLHVQHTWTVTEQGRKLKKGTKSGRARYVPVPKEVGAELAALCADRDPAEFLFRASKGAALDDHNWRSRLWSKAVVGAGLDGIEGLTTHSLRHTFASIAIKGGVDIITLQKVMGHRKPSITLDIYGHMYEDHENAVSAIMSEAIMSIS